jgi:endoglucanase Acf2
MTLGNEQKWLIYCSDSVQWKWNKDTSTVSTEYPIDGVVRVAVLPSTDDAADAAVIALQPYIRKYPTGATAVSVTTPLLRQPVLTGVVEWRYTTAGDREGRLLMLALPHQVPNPKSNFTSNLRLLPQP